MADSLSRPSAGVVAHADTGRMGSADLSTPQLYRPVHDWLDARPGRRVAAAAGLLIALQAVWRLSLALQGWFVGDDFAFIERSFEYPLYSHKYLFLAYASHFMPGAFAEVWLMSRSAPYNFVLPVLADTVMQLLTAILVYRILTALFGRRWVVIAPLAIFLCTTITLPAFVWWAAALNQAPMQLAFAGAVLNQIRYLQTGGRKRGLAGVACVLGGLAFSEKTLLAIPFVLVLTTLFFVDGPPWLRPFTLLRRMKAVTLSYLFVGATYSAFYVLAVPSPTHEGATSTGFVTLIRLQTFYALIPGLFGGPWHWEPLGTNAALADPSITAVVACAVALGAVIALSVRMAHRAVFGWYLLLGYVLTNVTLLGFSRAAIVGPGLGLEYRYITDVALVATLCISLAVIPISGTFALGVPQRLVTRTEARQALARWREGQLAEALPNPPRPSTMVAVLTILLVVSSVVSSTAYVRIFSPNYARPLLTNVRASAAKLPAGARVADTPVPSAVVWSMVYPYTLPSRVLRPLGLRLNYLRVGDWTNDLFVVDDHGRFRRASINGLNAVPGPQVNCGWRVDARPVTVPLPNRTIVPWNWIVRIGYIATDDATTVITAGDTSTTVSLKRGVGVAYLMVQGSVDAVRIGGLSNGAGLCTNDIQVGTPDPIQGSGP